MCVCRGWLRVFCFFVFFCSLWLNGWGLCLTPKCSTVLTVSLVFRYRHSGIVMIYVSIVLTVSLDGMPKQNSGSHSIAALWSYQQHLLFPHYISVLLIFSIITCRHRNFQDCINANLSIQYFNQYSYKYYSS